MQSIYKTLLFKYKDNLFLGILNDSGNIEKFSKVNYIDKFPELGENSFYIVMVDQKGQKFTMTTLDECLPNIESDEPLIIGELDNESLFNTANDILIEYKKTTYH